MFGSFRRTFGLIKVKETDTDIQVTGVPADILARDIAKIWNTQRINKYMFKTVNHNGFSFPKFFAVEVHYMLQQIDIYKYSKSSVRTIHHLIRELEENTWLKRLTEEHDSRVDLSQLGHLNAKLFEHQGSFVEKYGELTELYDLNGYLLSADPGTGKAQPLDAPIRVPGGWSTMGDMAVGTKVIAKDGTVSEVTGVFPQGEKLIYRVTFADGRTTECCGEHLWKVRWRGNGRLQSQDVVDTKTMADHLSRGDDHRFHIPLIDPEDRPEREYPIDPYVLGVLIGDGHLCEGKVHVSTPDQFIVEELERAIPSELTVGHISNYDYRVKAVSGHSNSYLYAIRALGLAEKRSVDKFIPPDYLDGSAAQRLALLQGLMDTDGTADQSACTSYSTSSEQLARDVQRLVWSLGGIASISSRIPHYTYKGKRMEGKRAYRVWIRYRKPSDLFRLKRKRELTKDNGQYVSNLMLKITSIEPIGMKEAQCIMVDHPEHLYVTSDYIVTHNTIMGLAVAECLRADLIVIVSPKNAIHRVWTSTIEWLYKKPQKYWVANSGAPYNKERIIVTHYEAIGKTLDAVKSTMAQRAVVILDESHNLNEAKSGRTKLFLELCKKVRSKNVLWSSGTPLKAMGYEMIPLLRSIDPLFTQDAEERFLKIFGRASDRALDILRNRIGKVSFHVAGAEVINVAKTYKTWKIKMPNAKEYTLDAIKVKMKKFVEERIKYYRKHFKDYKHAYWRGVEIYEAQMPVEDKKDYKRYRKAIKAISKGYDPKIHKEAAVFVNNFEKTQILPSISNKEERDAFKNARSVVKYVHLKVLGEALGKIVGKARSQCQIDMAAYTDWKKIAEMSEKKVLVFTSYVEVVKAISEDLKKAGFKSLLVYAETNAEIASMVNRFSKDTSIRFMVATYQSLSTAVPLTMADVTVFTSLPWRSFELEQAEARTARIGQDAPVKYITTLLDTGEAPNISTRSRDIMEWSREQVTQMMQSDIEGIGAQLNSGKLEVGTESIYNVPDKIMEALLPQLPIDVLEASLEGTEEKFVMQGFHPFI